MRAGDNILDEIVSRVSSQLQKKKRDLSWRDLESLSGFELPVRPFRKSLISDELSVIAELKKASPVKGVIRENFNPLELARAYEEAGASALSVLTEPDFFQGDLENLEKLSSKVSIPLLRKDFIIDPYQVKEAKAYGADAVLIIVTITSGSQLEELIHAGRELGIDLLIECYSQDDLERLDWKQVEILGVNNRNLKSFKVELHRGIDLLNQAPDHLVKVSESGLSTPDDLQLLSKEGIDAALIGEFLMQQNNPGYALQTLLNKARQNESE